MSLSIGIDLRSLCQHKDPTLSPLRLELCEIKDNVLVSSRGCVWLVGSFDSMAVVFFVLSPLIGCHVHAESRVGQNLD